MTSQNDEILINGQPVSDLAERFGTPLYVYDFNLIQQKVRSVQEAFAPLKEYFNLYYAVKANHHPAIIQWIHKLGAGVDVSSPGELGISLGCGIPPSGIIYTGNYESEAELKFALEQKVQINLDSIDALKRLQRSGLPERISFRINPGYGKGKFKGITTGGENTKFGIPETDVVEAYRLAKEMGIKRFGAHTMTGSGVLDPEHFICVLKMLLPILGEVHKSLNIEFEFIDIGGGLGIPYSRTESPLDIKELADSLIGEFKKGVAAFHLGKPHFAIEPGRYLVGDAGFLIARVNGIKKGAQNYVGIDAGMNTLLRPALYGAEHHIWVNKKTALPNSWKASVCGQICESTDILARDIELPEIEEGDLLVIGEAGAYGRVMSLEYNARPRAAEIALYNGNIYHITQRETVSDLLRNHFIPDFVQKDTLIFEDIPPESPPGAEIIEL